VHLDVGETLVEFRVEGRQFVHGTVDAGVLRVTEQLRQEERRKRNVHHDTLSPAHCWLGFVELCAKILQIMRKDFKDYARTFCKLFLPLFAKNLFRFCITHSRIQNRPILCLWDWQNSLPPSSKTSDFLYCLAWSAALTLAEQNSWYTTKRHS